jgi:flavin reductase (DIM6/NTAB) family NADH-FMN oxidoreductase RutF
MDREFVTYRMAELDLIQVYELMTAAIVPRPIAFVSTCDADDVPNLAPFSFFMVGGSNPPSVMFSPTLSDGGEPKDTLRNVLATGEFVVNTVHRAMAAGMNAAGVPYPARQSEWEASGFTAIPSLAVRPSRILESLIQLECKLFTVVEHGMGPHAARYVIGEVVVAHIEVGTAADPSQMKTLSRLGGRQYADLESLEVFESPG